MNPDELFQKDFLERDDINELKATPEGRRAIGLWIHREKCSCALAKLFIELGIDLPPKEEQERLSALLFRWTSPAVPVWELMTELGHAQELLEKFGMGADIAAFCGTEDCKGNA